MLWYSSNKIKGYVDIVIVSTTVILQLAETEILLWFPVKKVRLMDG